MRATAIVPVKRFARAKQRLVDHVGAPARATLAKAMLADVLAAISRTNLVERVIVVTGEGRAERVALAHSQRTTTALEVFQDPRDAGHSEAATLGIVRAKSLGAGCAVLLPGDCPLLDHDELDAALGRAGANRVAVIPDRHGTGTNGLILSPVDAIGPAFDEGSRERHADRARRAGYEVAVEQLPSLALDLDTPADLDALADELAAEPERATATAAALAELGLERGRTRR